MWQAANRTLPSSLFALGTICFGEEKKLLHRLVEHHQMLTRIVCGPAAYLLSGNTPVALYLPVGVSIDSSRL